jgi:hypothetical protein
MLFCPPNGGIGRNESRGTLKGATPPSVRDRIQIDTEAWPLAVVTFPRGEIVDADFDAYLNELGIWLDAGDRYATVTDTTQMERPIDARQRARLDDWIDARTSQLRRVSAGNALVVSSTLMRGVLNALYWVKKPPNPHHVVPTLGEAIDWCNERLEFAPSPPSVPPPPIPQAPTSLASSTAAASPVPRGDINAAGQVAGVMDAFSEAAFLVDDTGEFVFANHAARREFPTLPVWLRSVVSLDNRELQQLCRTTRVTQVSGSGRSVYLVVPCPELVPPSTPDPRQEIQLPPSLARIGRLLAQGKSDKEIANDADLPLSTVRTYVTRIFRKVGVHSRGEFIRLWATRA